MNNFHCLSKFFQPNVLIPLGAQVKNTAITSKSQKLLQCLGVVRNANVGTSFLLPLGVRSLRKLERLVREEMNKLDAYELNLPYLSPVKLWNETKRSDLKELYKLTDRHNHEYVLNPTAEEAAASFVASEPVRSYKQLPLRLYQISRKFRDEMKPRFGLIRSKEFIMKDLYCFDCSKESSTENYNLIVQSYHRIFNRLGVPYVFVDGCTGDMGGSISHEFHFPATIGDDTLVICNSCGHAENFELHQNKETCNSCHSSKLTHTSGIEVGHTFLLGTKYSEPLNTVFLDKDGKKEYLHMSSFGLGLSRIIAASVEVLSSDVEARWPVEIVPFTFCIITPKDGSKEEPATTIGHNLYTILNEKYNDDIILDDRGSMTIGKRLMDAKRFGYPYVVVIGKHAMQSPPLLELHNIYNNEIKLLDIDGLLQYLQKGDNKIKEVCEN